MKSESTESNRELHQAEGTDRVESSSVERADASNTDKNMKHHDIRASLAIINGYSAALDSSFSEFKALYDETFENKDGSCDETSSARLMTLEADCRFCLSRMYSSVEKLKERLESESVLQSSAQK